MDSLPVRQPQHNMATVIQPVNMTSAGTVERTSSHALTRTSVPYSMVTAERKVDTETYYKGHLDYVMKENKKMKTRLEVLEQENRDLKKTVYELSARLSSKGSAGVFNIEKVLGNQFSKNQPDLPDPTHADICVDTVKMAKDKRAEKEKHIDADARELLDDDRMFYFKYMMKGHTGAVYHVSFSPCGTMLASSSFDRTVKIWHMDDSAREGEAQSLEGHSMIVPEVSWSYDSKSLVSGSFDHQVKLWDVAQGQSVFSAEVGGFVQTVAFEPSESTVFYAGTTEKQIHVFDRREAGPVASLSDDSMVNSIYVFRTGRGLLTGDSSGRVKTWDMRKMKVIDASFSGQSQISHVHCSRPAVGDTEGTFVAVNCFDNVLRVYKRTIGLGRGLSLGEDKNTTGSEASGVPRMRLLHSLEGHRNKNWMIKSSFFLGSDYEIGALWRVEKKDGCGSDDNEDNDEEGQARHTAKTLEASLLLATGSADKPGSVFLFDVGGPEGSGELVQRLEVVQNMRS